MADKTVADKTIDYAERYQLAVIGMVRDILSEVAEEGLPGAHHFYITFQTGSTGVHVSPSLREHYPDVMTIVLQNQFWGLTVDEVGFSVTLKFGGTPEPLEVPWTAVVAFADPSAEFGLQFKPEPVEAPGDETDQSATKGTGQTDAEDAPAAGSEQPSAVLDFDKFRKR